jgi:hypothetical protein
MTKEGKRIVTVGNSAARRTRVLTKRASVLAHWAIRSTDRRTRVLTKGASVPTHWAIVLTGGAEVLTGGA